MTDEQREGYRIWLKAVCGYLGMLEFVHGPIANQCKASTNKSAKANTISLPISRRSDGPIIQSSGDLA